MLNNKHTNLILYKPFYNFQLETNNLLSRYGTMIRVRIGEGA